MTKRKRTKAANANSKPPPYSMHDAVAYKPRYSVAESAWLLGVSYAHIWKRIWNGDLPHVRDGARVYVTHSALVEYADKSHAKLPWGEVRRA